MFSIGHSRDRVGTEEIPLCGVSLPGVFDLLVTQRVLASSAGHDALRMDII